MGQQSVHKKKKYVYLKTTCAVLYPPGTQPVHHLPVLRRGCHGDRVPAAGPHQAGQGVVSGGPQAVPQAAGLHSQTPGQVPRPDAARPPHRLQRSGTGLHWGGLHTGR